jgi:GMP synthase-like glutamine amidotransferase
VAPEFGVVPLTPTEHAARDPLLAGIPSPVPAMQWHEDTFDLPDGATALARNETCLQAFRLDGSWGVQFHPEVEADVLDTWIAHYDTNEDAQRLGRDSVTGREEAQAKLEGWNEIGRSLASRFLEVVERRAR